MKCTNSQVYILWMLACVYICVTQYQSSTIKIRSITFTPGCSAGLFPLSPPPLSWGEHSLLSSFTDKFFPPLEFHVNTGYFPSCSTSFTQHNASEIHSCCLYPSFTPSSVQSVTPSRLTLCDPMDCSTPGLPVHHQLPELAQTHVHRVDDAIQPSHPLSSPSPPAPNPSQHQGLFQRVSSSHQVAKVLEFQLQHQCFQWTPRTDLL